MDFRPTTPRLEREARTIEAMLALYCRHHHASAPRESSAAGSSRRALCTDCAALEAYARKRLALCTYGAEKPTCVNCPIHCYGKRQREEVREVMRWSGPRMLLRHPWLAIAHLIDGRRPAPPRPAVRRIAAPPPPEG